MLTGGVVAVAAVAGAAGLLAAGDRSDPAGASAPATRTASVERRTLVSRETASGTLGYAGARRVRGSASGTITAVVREGARLRRGQALYRVDGQAVRILAGEAPAWRTLEPGVEGRDVKALEYNLVKLGYDPGGVDGDFDAETAAAVRDWQDDVGWEETGRVELGQVVFQPGLRRAAEVEAEIGDAVRPGASVLTTTLRRRQISVDLDADRQTLARRGASVQITLPDGRSARGRVTSVGTVAHAGGADEGEDEPSATIPVTISLTDQGSAGRLDGAPVTVGFAAEVSRHALAVPVTALLAVRGGGYAVQVAEGGRLRTVAVRVGQFADGYVAVSGRGIRRGDKVAVPDEL